MHGLRSVRGGEKAQALHLLASRHQSGSFSSFDARAHGDSGGHMCDLTLGTWVDDALCALDFVDSHHGRRPHVIVGSSLGGLVAAHIAALQPTRVAALVLLAPAFGFFARLEQHCTSGSGDILVPSRYVEGGAIALSRRFLDSQWLYDEGRLADALGQIPLFCAHGRRDDVVPYTSSQAFFENVPAGRKRLLIVDGEHRLTGHIGHIFDEMEGFLVAELPVGH
jgi:pimeloyl-ACP methyl ester carboxylesterase